MAVTNALGQTVTYQYTPRGELAAIRGTAAEPVNYTYDAYGRKRTMTTYRTGGGGDTTTWVYDEATGLLTEKIYADGQKTTYTYTPDGKLLTRTWARGLTTTYTYDETTGDLLLRDYSDSTPDVTFADYDDQGRRTPSLTSRVRAA